MYLCFKKKPDVSDLYYSSDTLINYSMNVKNAILLIIVAGGSN
jgi:hypothetical protein